MIPLAAITLCIATFQPAPQSTAGELEALIAEGQPEGENAWPAIEIAFDRLQTAEHQGLRLIRSPDAGWDPPPEFSDFGMIDDPAWRDDPFHHDVPHINWRAAEFAEWLVQSGRIDEALATLDDLRDTDRPVVFTATVVALDADGTHDMLYRSLTAARSLNRALVAAATHAAAEREVQTAARHIDRALALASALVDQQLAVPVMTAASIEGRVFETLERRFYRDEWRFIILRDTIACFDRRYQPIKPLKINRAEALLEHIMVEDMGLDSIKPDPELGLDPEDPWNDPKFQAMLRRSFNSRETNYHLARTALAVELYRLTHSKLPTSLAELRKPTDRWPYLDDPFADAEPSAKLRYRLDPTHPHGFTLYSLGPNGVDDDGAPLRSEGDPTRAHELSWHGDIVWAAPERDK